MKKKVLYNDQFFAGDPGDVRYFSASIYEEGFDDITTATLLDLEVGDIEGGLSWSFDIAKPERREEALRAIRKLSEGFRNLLSKLEHMDGNRS
jgi:hypothetical protein